MTRVINQKGVVFDALSVGPIEGLVEGAKSIYLDNTPITSRDFTSAVEISPVIETTASCEANSAVVKVPLHSVKILLDTETSTVPETLGDMLFPELRYLFIEKAGRTFPHFAMAPSGLEWSFTDSWGRDGEAGGFYRGKDKYAGYDWNKRRFTQNVENDTKNYISSPLPGNDFWPHDYAENDLFYTATIDGIENYRTYIVGRSVDQYAYRRRDDATGYHSARYFENEQDWRIHWQMVKNSNWKDNNQFYQTWHYFANPIQTWPFLIHPEKNGYWNQLDDRHNSWEDTQALQYTGMTNSITWDEWYGATLRWDVLAEIINIKKDPIDPDNTALVTIKPKNPSFHKVFTTRNNAKAKILTSNVKREQTTNFRGDWDIRNGELHQTPMYLENFDNPTTNLMVGPNQGLYWNNEAGGTSSANFYGAVGSSGTAMGLTDTQVREVDGVKVTIAFPGGLYFANDEGEVKSAVAEFAMYVHTRRGPAGDEYKSNHVVGRLDPSLPEKITSSHWLGGGQRNSAGKRLHDGTYYNTLDAAHPDKGEQERKFGVIIAKTKGTFAKEFQIDLTPYKPFTDFLVEVRRVTPDQHIDYNTVGAGQDDVSELTNAQAKTRFEGAAVLTTIEAQLNEKMTYPLTAYSGLSFSGAEFDAIPNRTYHLRGLKVKVPSNYTTREEDRANGGSGVASYSRFLERDAHTEGVDYPSYSAKRDNVLRFSFTPKELIRGKWGNAIGDEAAGTGIHIFKGTPTGETAFGGLESTNGPLPFLALIEGIDRRNITSGDTHSTTYSLRIAKTINGHAIAKDELEQISVTQQVTGKTQTIRPNQQGTFRTEPIGGSGGDKDDPRTRIVQGVETEYWQIFGTIADANGSYEDNAIFPDAEHPYDIEITFSKNIFNPVFSPWDGSFRGDESLPINNPNRQKVYTNNPAWIYYDILTNKEIGLGQWIQDSDIDKFELYQIARYCDQLVPDGQGGLEARFTLNTYITKAVEAFKLLKDLTSAFRAMATYSNGLITAVQDRPKEPVYLFSQSNVIQGQFNYEYTGTRARANSVLVTWNDPSQNYVQDVVAVDDTEAIRKAGRVIPKEIIAYGCTSKGQAMRLGKYHLLSEKLETEVITFQTSINASHLQLGDIIKVQDQQAGAKVINAGRIKFSNGWRQFQLDRDVDLSTVVEGDNKWKLHIQVPVEGIFLQQSSAVINGKTLKKGDLISEDKNGIAIEDLAGTPNPVSFEQKETFESIDKYNLTDDNGNMISTQIQKYSRIDIFDINVNHSYTERGPQYIQTVEPRDDKTRNIDITGCMWTITKEPGNTYNETACKQYKIMAISFEEENKISITASLHKEEKFDEVEATIVSYKDPVKAYNNAGYVVRGGNNFLPITGAGTEGGDTFDESSSNLPIPSITGIDFSVANQQNTLINVVWGVATADKIDSSGRVVQTPVSPIINGYRIKHNFTPSDPAADVNGFVYQTVDNPGVTSVDIVADLENTTYIVTIEAYHQEMGQSKTYGTAKTLTKEVSGVPKTLGRSRLPAGGDINKPIDFSPSGKLTILGFRSNYTYSHPNGSTYTAASNTAALENQEDFSSMANNTTAFLYFDKAGSLLDTRHPLKAVRETTDVQATRQGAGGPLNFTYIMPLGSSTRGLATLTNLTGTGKVQNSPGSSVDYEIKSVTGSITKDMVVTGSGISTTVTLTEEPVSLGGNKLRIKLSSAHNLSNDTVLTFTGTAGFTSVSGNDTITGKNTQFTTDFSTGDLIKLTEDMNIAATGVLSEYGIVKNVINDAKLQLEEPVSRTYGKSNTTTSLSYGDLTAESKREVDYYASGATTNIRPQVVSITKADPAVVTFSSVSGKDANFAGYSSSSLIPFYFFGVEGMTEINSRLYYLNPQSANVAHIYTANSKTVGNQLDTSGSGFTAHTADTGLGHFYSKPYYSGGSGQREVDESLPNRNFYNTSDFGHPSGGVYESYTYENKVNAFANNISKDTVEAQNNVAGKVVLKYQTGKILTVTITNAGSNICNGFSGIAPVKPKKVLNAGGTSDSPDYFDYRSRPSTNERDIPEFLLTITNGEVTGVEVVNGGLGQFVGYKMNEFRGWDNANRQVYNPTTGTTITDYEFEDDGWVNSKNFVEPTITIATVDGVNGILDSFELNSPFINSEANDVIQLYIHDPSIFTAEFNPVAAVSFKVATASVQSQAIAYKQEQKVNVLEDALLAEVTKDSSGEYSIDYLCTKASLDTSDAGSIIESASTEVTGAYVYSSSRDRGKVAVISMPNTRGLSATPTAQAEITGSLGYQSPDIAISEITSGQAAVFTTSAAHGLLDGDYVQIKGISAGDGMSAINGTRGKVTLGSRSLVTGSNSDDSKIADGTVFYGSGVSAAGVTNCTMKSYPSPRGVDGLCTVTASGTSCQIDAITAGGSNYTAGETLQITVNTGGQDYFYFAVLQSDGVVSNDTTTKFTVETGTTAYGYYFIQANHINTSAYTALTSQSTVFANIVNPLTLEMVISATFDNVSETIPAASITDAGQITSYVVVYVYAFTYIMSFMDIKEDGVTAEALIEKYNLYPGATVRQGTSSNPTFHGHILYVQEIGTDGTIRVGFNDLGEDNTETSTNPAIRAYSVYGTNEYTNGEQLGSVGPGSTSGSALTFSGITHSSILDGEGVAISGRSPSGATFAFSIAENGTVTATGDGVVAQGSGYDDRDRVTISAAALNSANSAYATNRGDLTFRIDTTGNVSSSVDATLTFTGTSDTTVATVTDLLTEPEGSKTITLRGEIPKKSTDNYDVLIRGYTLKSDGYEPSSHDHFDETSAAVDLNAPDGNMGLSSGAAVNIIGLEDINPSIEYFINHAGSGAITIHKDASLSTALPGTGIATPGTFTDPDATTFVRGSQGYVVGRCASSINYISLIGELKV